MVVCLVTSRHPLDAAPLQLLRAKGGHGDEFERIRRCRSINHRQFGHPMRPWRRSFGEGWDVFPAECGTRQQCSGKRNALEYTPVRLLALFVVLCAAADCASARATTDNAGVHRATSKPRPPSESRMALFGLTDGSMRRPGSKARRSTTSPRKSRSKARPRQNESSPVCVRR